MKAVSCLLGLHKWEITPAVYDSVQAQLLAIPTQEASRTCRCCGKTQVEDRHCLGLNPPQYDSTWYTVISQNHASQG